MSALETEKSPARDRLVEAAGEVFADVGYHAATIRQITKRAGVNVAAVNYYFRDKQELYEAALLHAQHCAGSALPPAEGSPEERVRAFVRNLLRRFLDPLRPAWHGKLLARELASPTQAFARILDETLVARCRFLDRALAEIAGERVPRRVIERMAASIIGQCIFYRQNRRVTQLLYPEATSGEDPIEELTDHITAFSLGGIRRIIEESKNHGH